MIGNSDLKTLMTKPAKLSERDRLSQAQAYVEKAVFKDIHCIEAILNSKQLPTADANLINMLPHFAAPGSMSMGAQLSLNGGGAHFNSETRFQAKH